MSDSSTIALGPWGRGQQTGASNPLGGTNPLQLMTSMMQLRQQQAEFAARGQFGQIMATSPDLETAMQRAQQNPQVAGWAPQLMGELRQQQLLQQQLQGQQLTNTGTGMGQLIQAMHMAMGDPQNLGNFVQSRFSTLPPDVQKATMPLAQSVMNSLLTGLPTDNPAVAQQMYKQRMMGVLVGSGMKPEDVYQAYGNVPPQVVTGPYGAGGAQTPVLVGGLGQGNAPGGGVGSGGGSPPGALGPSGPSITQQNYQQTRGPEMAKYQSALDERVQVGTTMMQTLEEARDALSQARAGGGATFYSRLGQLAQAIGAPDDLVNKLANGNLAASQEFEKLMVNTTMAQIRGQIPEGSRLNRQEFETFTRNNPNLDTDPRAINKIFNFWSKLYVRDRLEQRMLNTHLREGGDVSEWPEKWNSIMQNIGIATPVFTGPNGTPIAPESAAHLLQNPGTVEQFDQRYGPGSGERYLQGGGL